MHAGYSISACGASHPACGVYRIRVKRLSTDTDSWEQGTQVTVCQGTVRAQGHNSRWASLDTTQPCYLCRACFAKDVPEPQGLISSSGDDGLPIRRHGLQKGQRGLAISSCSRQLLGPDRSRQVPGDMDPGLAKAHRLLWCLP